MTGYNAAAGTQIRWCVISDSSLEKQDGKYPSFNDTNKHCFLQTSIKRSVFSPSLSEIARVIVKFLKISWFDLDSTLEPVSLLTFIMVLSSCEPVQRYLTWWQHCEVCVLGGPLPRWRFDPPYCTPVNTNTQKVKVQEICLISQNYFPLIENVQVLLWVKNQKIISNPTTISLKWQGSL